MKNGSRKKVDIFALMIPEIREYLKTKNFSELKTLLKTVHSMDLAEGWHTLEPADKILVFKLLGTKKAVEVFEYLSFEEQTYLLNNLDNAEVAQIINEMSPDERADLFKEFPAKVSRKFISLVRREEAANIKELIEFQEGTAGSLMTTDFVTLRKDMTARQAIISVQENLRTDSRESINTAFITDDSRKLLGSVSLQDILKAPADIPIKEIMSGVDFIKLEATSRTAEVADLFKKYDLLDAPVVDTAGRIVGIITVDDIVEQIERNTTKQMYEIGKMDASGGEIISYAQATVFELVKRRAGWLILLLVFDFLTGTVLKNFEHTLSAVVALTFFIPMLLDTGGNAGAQTSITIIRGLATGDVKPGAVKRIIKLEFSAALLMGLIIGAVAFGRALLLQKDPVLALVVGLSMLIIAVLAIGTGIFLPLFSKRVGLDPAVLAGPITTSIVDVVGLIIYFKIAQFFIPVLRF